MCKLRIVNVQIKAMDLNGKAQVYSPGLLFMIEILN